MDVLRHLLFEKERIGKVLELIKKEGIPVPETDPDRALVYARALHQYGDIHQAYRIYTGIPPGSDRDAERLWGLADSLNRMGDLPQAKQYLDQALQCTSRLNVGPPLWLRLQIYNTQVSISIHEGQFEKASARIEKAIAESLSEPQLIVRWMLEGNRGILLFHQGHFDKALLALERAVKQLSARDAVASAGHNLVSLGMVFENLGDIVEYGRCLERAEPFVRKSGSLQQLIYLRYSQGFYCGEHGPLYKAEQCFEEALDLLREFPIPLYEIFLAIALAKMRFKKGRLADALRLIRDARNLAREKGGLLYVDDCLFIEAVFLLRSGAVQEGLEILKEVEQAARSQDKHRLDVWIALYFAFGHEELKDKPQALHWLQRCLEAAERTKTASDLLTEKEVVIPLLLKLGDELPITESLSKLLVRLRHPGLLKQLLSRSSGAEPEGKILFLRSLKVHDARPFRRELARFKKAPEKEVRRTASLLLNGWSQHTTYRVYTLGPLRVLSEGRLLSDRDWVRPVAKRLFLFFLTSPGIWHEREAVHEELWKRTSPESSAKVLESPFYLLRTVFEPWHLPDMDYVFLKSRRGAYGFFPERRFWIDYQELEQGIKQAESAHRDRNFKEARKAYREALDLYIGDYLEEFPYEDWLNPKRDHLRELYNRGVIRYATLERDSGNLHEARRVLEEALFKDISRCDCTALLIQVLAQMKLSQQAKDWGQRHITYLKKELKEKPTPEVVEALGKLG